MKLAKAGKIDKIKIFVRMKIRFLIQRLKMISSPYCAVSEPNVYKH